MASTKSTRKPTAKKAKPAAKKASPAASSKKAAPSKAKKGVASKAKPAKKAAPSKPKPTAQAQASKTAKATKAPKDVLDFGEFPAGAVTRHEVTLCLSCIYKLFTNQLGLAPRTAYNEIRRYAPT